MDNIFIALSLIPFYLLGVFPSGYLIALKSGKNITESGSGNVGATNVARVIGKKAGALTLLLDILKGMLAVGIATLLWPGNDTYAALAAFIAVLGHCLSIPPILKGGKGVATALGTLIVLSPYSILIGVCAFTATYVLTTIVSLGSVVAVVATALSAFFFEEHSGVIASICGISLLIIYRHKSNLMRLAEGREEKLNI